MLNTSAGLAVSDTVYVSMSIAPLAAGYQNFGSMLIVGSSPVVDTFERLRQYANITEVGVDFGNTTPEFLAAELFFEQQPQPALCYIGRWAQSAAAGMLHGATLSAAQALYTNFTAQPTNAALFIVVDGNPISCTGMNMTGQLNMNGVAGVLQTALGGAGVATVLWNASYKRFDITSASTGVNSSIGYGASPTAWNKATFSGVPANNDTITINGVVITFTTAAPANQNQSQLVAGNLPQTLINLAATINASNDGNVSLVAASINSLNTVLYLQSKLTGIPGNSYTLAKSSSAITVSTASFAGGSGTDVSTLFGLTAASGAVPPVVGLASETAISAVTALAQASGAWYGLGFASNPMPQTNDYVGIANYIEASARARVFAVTTQDPLSMQPNYSLDVGSLLQELDLSCTFVQFSSNNPYAAMSAFGRAFTVNFEGVNTTITLKFKQEPGVTFETLNETQAATLDAKNINYFVLFNNQTSILQQGVMANGWFFDERHGLHWLQNRLQNDVWNALYTSTTKIPQTDDGTHVLTTTCDSGCSQAKKNGLFAPGIWTGPPVGNITTGTPLPLGYTIYAPLVATQAQADREKRRAVPIAIYGKFAGAIHFANIAVTVNR